MDPNFIFIVLGANTLIIFLFKRDWLLKQESFLYLLYANILLFILGYVFHYTMIGNPKLVVALKMPLLSQLLFISMVYIFRKLYNRDPVDTFWTMEKNKMKDGVFNFIFCFTGIVLPAFIIFH